MNIKLFHPEGWAHDASHLLCAGERGPRARVVCVQTLYLNLKIDIYIQENLWG